MGEENHTYFFDGWKGAGVSRGGGECKNEKERYWREVNCDGRREGGARGVLGA